MTENLIYKKDYYGFVYLWYDLFRDKLCIGSHFGALTDGYTTSTGHCKFAIKKRPNDFRRIILYLHIEDNVKSLREKEQLFLDNIPEDLLGKYFYNLKKFAIGGGVIGSKKSEETKLKISLAQKGKKRNQIFNIKGLIAPKPIKTCNFCNKKMDIGNYTKYHGKNCKCNPNVDKLILEKRTIIAKKAAKISVENRIKSLENE